MLLMFCQYEQVFVYERELKRHLQIGLNHIF